MKHFNMRLACAWLINDLYKNETETGAVNWIELKGGRLPLPVVIAIHTLPEQNQQEMISVITQIWDLYRPIFEERMNSDVIEHIEQIDKSNRSKELFSQFNSLMTESDVKKFISDELERRLRIVRMISVKYEGLKSLSFFLTAIEGYILEKRIKRILRGWEAG